MSGGPGDGDVHETVAMRDLAVRLGVPAERIVLDRDGLNSEMTAANTVALAQRDGFGRVLAVSHAYHLPRVKLTFQRHGLAVRTVPAKQRYTLRIMPWLVARETAALWTYYFQGLSTCG